MKHPLITFALIALALFAATACGSTQHEPVGIGSGADQLIRSPCVGPCAPIRGLSQWRA